MGTEEEGLCPGGVGWFRVPGGYTANVSCQLKRKEALYCVAQISSMTAQDYRLIIATSFLPKRGRWRGGVREKAWMVSKNHVVVLIDKLFVL